jgi:spermidine synthase
VVGSVTTPEGVLELRERGPADFLITIGGRVLMTSTARRSEEALATLACARLPRRDAPPRILIGGLGMAYTLRAALDALPASAQVVVAELHAVVESWCRGPLSSLTDGAVADPRVHVQIGDVAQVVRATPPGTYDAILFDLYEGPHPAGRQAADPFYGAPALGRARAALSGDGILAVWSEELAPAFARRFATAGFDVASHRAGHGGRSHVVYLGRKIARSRRR